MINYLKQFEALVTELKNDPFVRARFKLVAQVIITTVISLFLANVILNYSRDYELRVRLTGRLADQKNEEAIIDSLGRALNRDHGIIFIGLGGAIILIGYILTGWTLAPIRQILRAQKRFIADASHELRTPLSIMKTNSEVLLMDGDNINPRDSIGALKSNIEEIDRMSKLIENLLRLSYYDNKTPEIPLYPVNLSEIVKSIVDKAKTLAMTKTIRLTVTDADDGKILGNPTALEQLIINIVKNAILYTPEGGTVTVSVKNYDSSGVRFNVRDTGVGIDPKEIPSIFNPFYKTETSKSIYNGGSGLGLTIVKKIVDRHLGQISVESDIGKGTSVTVSFPNFRKTSHATQNLTQPAS